MAAGKRILLMTSRSWAGQNLSPPIGLYSLRSEVERFGHQCDVFDYDVDSDVPIKERIAGGYYDIIGMSVTHLNMPMDLDTIAELRELSRLSGRRTLFVAGGQEATMNARQWLDSGVIDVCFLGYAESSFGRFCNSWPRSWDDIPGLAYYDADGEYRFNHAEKLTLEEFRRWFYARRLRLNVPYEKYWVAGRNRKKNALNNADFTAETVRLYTSSHCPRRCGFCSSQNFIPLSQGANSGILMLSAGDVFDLVQHHAITYGARAVMFTDDDFPIGSQAGIQRVFDFCDRIIEAKMRGRLPEEMRFFCQARVADFLVRGHVNLALIEQMKAAGWHNIGIGIETFSERLLHVPSVNKIGITVADCRAVMNALLNAEIIVQSFLILGIPETTVEELVETIEIASEYILRGADIGINSTMRAFPGSPVVLNGGYPIVSRAWANPLTGQGIEIFDYLVPFDPEISQIAGQINERAIEEQRRMVNGKGWAENTMVSKNLVGYTHFAAVAKLLGQDALAEMIEARMSAAA